MKLLADFHLHTNNSRFFHGKNSIEEMVRMANALGLKEIAITDHGFKHWCRTSKSKMLKARKEIDEINTWSSTKVLLGIEADIISEDGTIDVDNDILSILDILVVGYHKMIKTDFAGYFGGTPKTEESKIKCTNAYLNAIAKYPVGMISHLDSILTTDMYEIGKACAEKGVMVEINNRHTNWSEKEVNDLIASGCMFAVSSDAHSREDIANVENAFEIIRKYDIPSELVVNVEFEEYEKSDIDRAITPYMSIYEQRKKAREEKILNLYEKKTKEFTNSLSDEMESALKNIAREKGIHYTPLEEDDIESEDDILNFDKFIDQYGNFITIQKKEEFDAQNEEIESAQDIFEEEAQEDDNISDEQIQESNDSQNEAQIETETTNNVIQNQEVQNRQNLTDFLSSVKNETSTSSSDPKPMENQHKEKPKNGFGVMNVFDSIKKEED